ncbi:MAG TPA: acetate/propionate family kinase [Terriglobales bacterium]|nr:acetate/propionate family kinase [Terriglobales bacterium]
MTASHEETVILALNGGSSSFKLALYLFQSDKVEKLVWGEAEEIGSKNAKFWLRGNNLGLACNGTHPFADDAEAAQYLIGRLRSSSLPSPQAVGHRIVHGGPLLREHQQITPQVLAQLTDATAFAPVHLPPALDVVRRVMATFPNVPHIACFDTAFHRTMPQHAARLPFAAEFFQAGLQRYGFHGLSCESVVRALAAALLPRTVIAHLGSGCSITAIENGKSIETTMGMTPTGGVMMGTRSGDLDPGVLLNLLRRGYDQEQMDSLVNHNSGLYGVSGEGSDMRRLLDLREQSASARLAIEMFCYQVRKAIGAMAAVLGGMDMLVFTGGIGEHSPSIRAQICADLEHLGIAFNDASNQRNNINVALSTGKCDVRIIEADEDLEIALHSRRLTSSSQD